MSKKNRKLYLKQRINERRSETSRLRRLDYLSAKNDGEFPEDKKTSQVLEHLIKNLKGENTAIQSGRSSIIPVPRVFSFIEHPNKSINHLYSCIRATRNKKAKKIRIDHTECETIDLCSSMMTDIVMMEFNREIKARRSKRSFGGYLSQNEYVNNLLRSTGILHHLKIKGQEAKPEFDARFVKFPLMRGYRRKLEKKESTMQEKAADSLITYFDKCLNTYAFCLTGEGQAYIGNLAGEVLDNAERHSTSNRWWTVAYMEQDEKLNRGQCHIAFLSLGQTFHESMQKLEKTSPLRKEIEELVSLHRRKSSKWNFGSKFTEENLWTLYALQEGVSSSGCGGTGTISMIETFQNLGDTVEETDKPRMAIVSGSTQIKFDNKFRLKKSQIRGVQRNVIAFNETNTLENRPNPNNVRSLDGYFPGTIISLSFYIDPKWLKQLASSK